MGGESFLTRHEYVIKFNEIVRRNFDNWGLNVWRNVDEFTRAYAECFTTGTEALTTRPKCEY